MCEVANAVLNMCYSKQNIRYFLEVRDGRPKRGLSAALGLHLSARHADLEGIAPLAYI